MVDSIFRPISIVECESGTNNLNNRIIGIFCSIIVPMIFVKLIKEIDESIRNGGDESMAYSFSD